MDPIEASTATADAIGGFGTMWMTDMATYVRGGELGFQGMDFYVSGRGSALGEVPGDVVAAAFVFFNPRTVIESWDRSADVLPRAEAASEFAAVLHTWAEAKVPADVDVDLDRLAELTGTIVAATNAATAPLFAGWRALPEPDPSRAAALALHRLNALRELRGALHGASVIAEGLDPHAAVARRTPYMLEIFGWEPPHPEKDAVRETWAVAQSATEVACARAFEPLTEAERVEFAEAVNALYAVVSGG